MMAKLILICAALVTKFSVEATIVYTPDLQLHDGLIQGQVIKAGEHGTVNFYQGIRYGNAARWQKPTPAQPWTGVYRATSAQSICPQTGPLGDGWLPPQKVSEDCLFLSVYQPSMVNSSQLLPVMVYIHGGAFEIGSYNFDAKELAAREQVLVVLINYRLGPLGFMYGGGVSGNLGLYDQILALQWVQRNVRFFGGDSARVTLFGISAGSISIGALIISPLASGLFHRAIMQSGSPLVAAVATPPWRAEEKTLALAYKLHCPTTSITEAVACIRSLPLRRVLNASYDDFMQNDFFVPVYGTDELLPLRPVIALRTGQLNPVDVMYGANQDEGTFFGYALIPGYTTANYTVQSAREAIEQFMALHQVPGPAEIADYYLSQLNQRPTLDDLRLAIGRALGDYYMICPTILFGEEMARRRPTNNTFYSYQFTQHFRYLTFPAWMGVTHGSDHAYLFFRDQYSSDRKVLEQSNNVLHAWANFARIGEPGPIGGVQWEQAGATTMYMRLELSKYQMVANEYKDRCDAFWKPKLNA